MVGAGFMFEVSCEVLIAEWIVRGKWSLGNWSVRVVLLVGNTLAEALQNVGEHFIHVGSLDVPNNGFRANANCWTGLPPIRCSWMMRSRTWGVQE